MPGFDPFALHYRLVHMRHIGMIYKNKSVCLVSLDLEEYH